MSEEKQMPNLSDIPPVEAASSQAMPNMGEELQEMGRQLAALVKALWSSPEIQEMNTQAKQGLKSLEKSANQLAEQARETRVGQQVESAMAQASETVREKKIAETLVTSLSQAIQTLSKSIETAVEKVETRNIEVQVPPAAEAVETDQE